MSLIEILVVTAILTVTLGVLTSVTSSQHKVSTQLADKLASLDLARTLTATFAGGNVCTFMVTNAPPYQFNPMDLTSVDIPPYAAIPSRPVAGALPALEANGTALASPNSPRLMASQIKIMNVNCAVLPCTPATTQFNANMVVTFDNTKTVAHVPPLSFPIVITTTPNAGQQRLASCTMNAGGGGGTIGTQDQPSATVSCTGGPANPNCLADPVPSIANCPAGYEVSGCGYELAGWADYPANLSGDATPANDYLNNAPATVVVEGNGCRVVAGSPPGCGACFRAHAQCIRIQ